MPVDRCLERVACCVIDSGSMTDMCLGIRCDQPAPDSLVELSPVTLCWPPIIARYIPTRGRKVGLGND